MTSNFSTPKEAAYNYNDKIRSTKDALPEKKFYHRESLLSILFDNPHVRIVHHIFVALFLGLVTTSIAKDVLARGGNIEEYHLILAGFGGLPIALIGWIVQYSLFCCFYLFFLCWAYGHLKWKIRNSELRKIWDYSATLLLIGIYIAAFKLAAHIVNLYHLAPASAAIILVEQTRLLMKSHAFVRGNIPKVLDYKPKTDKDFKLPSFKYFLFFSMVPTLVYRDEYPRTKIIRWKMVSTHAMEIFGVIIFYSFALEKLLVPIYQDFGVRRFSYRELCIAFLETYFLGALFLLTTFYLVLHLVQNFFAEILRFGDRMFYKDWWLATDFTSWYRTWNVVVHDWLYTYVYKDCYEILLPGNKTAAKYATFFISAIVHEWILMNMFGFFFPVLFVMFFLFSFILTNIKTPKNAFVNVLFWMALSFGTGWLVGGYALEFYARYNDVPPLNREYDFYIPRSLTCNCYK